jgi:hypothetical protein
VATAAPNTHPANRAQAQTMTNPPSYLAPGTPEYRPTPAAMRRTVGCGYVK